MKYVSPTPSEGSLRKSGTNTKPGRHLPTIPPRWSTPLPPSSTPLLEYPVWTLKAKGELIVRENNVGVHLLKQKKKKKKRGAVCEVVLRVILVRDCD